MSSTLSFLHFHEIEWWFFIMKPPMYSCFMAVIFILLSAFHLFLQCRYLFQHGFSLYLYSFFFTDPLVFPNIQSHTYGIRLVLFSYSPFLHEILLLISPYFSPFFIINWESILIFQLKIEFSIEKFMSTTPVINGHLPIQTLLIEGATRGCICPVDAVFNVAP